MSVFGSHFLYTNEFDPSLIYPAFSIGLLSVAVLNINNMRDRVNDKQFGKATIAVRLGARNVMFYHLFLVTVPVILTASYGFMYNAVSIVVLSIIMLIPVMLHLKVVFQNKSEKLLDLELKKIALLTFFYAILFSVFSIVLTV